MKTKAETFKYSFYSGLLKRGEIKNRIQSYCFNADIDLKLTENSGVIQSLLMYEFKGSTEPIEKLKLFLEGLSNPYKPLFDEYKARKIVQNYGKSLERPLDENWYFTLSGIRSFETLKDKPVDIANAIKQIFLITSDPELRQYLYVGFTNLASYIIEDDYDKLLQSLNTYDKMKKEEKEEADKLREQVQDYLTTTREALENDFQNFQHTNGFI
jgi:hypothetical protein